MCHVHLGGSEAVVYKRDFKWKGHGLKTREQAFAAGRQQVAHLAQEIEQHTGFTLPSHRALDFGCGVGRLALPLAERCEHVYGLDVSPSVLQEAANNAGRMNVSNVEWVDAGRLAELEGRYDMVLSMAVFQHIRTREGERTFATLVRGLRPGGAGAIQLTLRPSHPVRGFLRWLRGGDRKTVKSPRKSTLSRSNPLNLLRGRDWSYLYMVPRSYSLNRLGRVLADEGVSDWHAKWHARLKSVEAVTIFFRKD